MTGELPKILSLLLLSYLLGSFPSGYLVGEIFKKTDVRQWGYGDTGATNTWKTVGRGLGALVGVLDIGKGMLATLLPLWVGVPYLAVWTGFLAVAGHIWPVFIGFRGGKGLATFIGVALVLATVPLIICLALWLALKPAIRLVALANLVAFSFLPVFALLGQKSTGMTLGFVALASLRWCVEWPHLKRAKRHK
ncbi:MAG: glycerol-3-phosphate acyltransferase [bacterium]|nr:glycerol-3-phosphate acyltransferase [bacterium]